MIDREKNEKSELLSYCNLSERFYCNLKLQILNSSGFLPAVAIRQIFEVRKWYCKANDRH